MILRIAIDILELVDNVKVFKVLYKYIKDRSLYSRSEIKDIKNKFKSIQNFNVYIKKHLVLSNHMKSDYIFTCSGLMKPSRCFNPLGLKYVLFNGYVNSDDYYEYKIHNYKVNHLSSGKYAIYVYTKPEYYYVLDSMNEKLFRL